MDNKAFWSTRYQENKTGWDIGYPSTPLKTYVDQLTNKDLRILIPGAGNAYEAQYLWESGFRNTFILDIADIVVDTFLEKNPTFPKTQAIIGDFFKHVGQYDLILEQTFFCSFPPLKETRDAYGEKMSELLVDGGKLRGVWFDFPLTDDMEKRPFGGTKEAYINHMKPFFQSAQMERCYNSIPPRAGNELWGMFDK